MESCTPRGTWPYPVASSLPARDTKQLWTSMSTVSDLDSSEPSVQLRLLLWIETDSPLRSINVSFYFPTSTAGSLYWRVAWFRSKICAEQTHQPVSRPRLTCLGFLWVDILQLAHHHEEVVRSTLNILWWKSVVFRYGFPNQITISPYLINGKASTLEMLVLLHHLEGFRFFSISACRQEIQSILPSFLRDLHHYPLRLIPSISFDLWSSSREAILPAPLLRNGTANHRRKHLGI